jgi:hypothetical protein
LGSTSFDTIVLTSGASPLSFDDFFNFSPSVSGLLSANSFEGTSAGSNVVNPFTIELFQVGNPIALASSSTINTSGSTENVQLSGVQLTGGVDYYVEVFGTLAANLTNVHIDGNVTLNPAPLPGALVLFGSAMLGLWGWIRRRGSLAS